MNKKGNVPETGSSQWKKNEKIINENPILKKARDKSQGFNTDSKSYSATHGGKGSARRSGDEQVFKDNYDQIDWGKKLSTNTNFRVKINGKYVDDK